MAELPVMLRVVGRRCVIVGGGAVALRRARALLEAGAEVRVVAPRVDAELQTLPVGVEQRPYRRGDLAGALLAVAATDDPAVNAAVAAEAREAGVLVNRADEPEAGDLTIPAHARHGPITLAVHTGGISAAAAATIRRQLSEALDPDWPRLLRIAAPYRELIQRRVPDDAARHERLTRLTGPEAMRTLKERGSAAFETFCDELSRG
jgi:precorrin-2 dehydrogenase / sirohydrochlorin ferrochelatase